MIVCGKNLKIMDFLIILITLNILTTLITPNTLTTPITPTIPLTPIKFSSFILTS